MFGKKPEDDQPVFMEREGRFLAHLSKEAYNWLGSRYAWYNKIRNAKKGGLENIFKERGLEEQMEATRSALSLVEKTLKNSMLLAYNSVLDAVKNSGTAPEEWPERIDTEDRGNPPSLGENQDGVVIAYNPLKFLNVSKQVRDKGKGLDFYVDGLVKKLTFKMIGYYAEESNWIEERYAYFLQNMEPEAGLQEVQAKISFLKTEIDLFCGSYQMFRFGRLKGRPDPSAKNTMEETFEITDEELVKDLYLQNYLVNGVSYFVFRYYIELLGQCRNPLAYKQISTIFQPLLSKTEEVLQQFQASFGMEREKARLRQVYLEFTKEMDSRAPVEVIEVKGQKTRRINYNIHRLENLAYSQSGKIMKRMEDNWKKYIQNKLLQNKDSNLAFKHLLEILNTLVKSSQFSMEGRIKVAQTIRKFADDQERLGKAQLGLRKRKFEEAKRKKSRELAKFRSQEQDKMVETIKRELVQLDEQSRADLQRMEESVNQRRDAQIAKVDHLEQAAREDREKNLGKSAGVLFRIAGEVDTERIIRGELVTHLVKQIQDDRDESYNILYKNLWDIFPDLFPTEKIVLRATIDKKIKLEDDELRISEQEMGSYQQQIANRKSELEGILPGVFDQKVSQGPVSIRLDNLLEMKLTSQSLRLLMQLPFNAPNKPPAKLPPQVVKHVLMINQLTHPMPENDIVLPNVGEDQPAAKRINFNRLQKISP